MKSLKLLLGFPIRPKLYKPVKVLNWKREINTKITDINCGLYLLVSNVKPEIKYIADKGSTNLENDLKSMSEIGLLDSIVYMDIEAVIRPINRNRTDKSFIIKLLILNLFLSRAS